MISSPTPTDKLAHLTSIMPTRWWLDSIQHVLLAQAATKHISRTGIKPTK
jgi:hypothetical protein